MKLIDEKGRLFGKVSIIDLLVILIFAMVLFVGLKLVFREETTVAVVAENQESIRYIIEIQKVRTPFEEMPKPGMAVYNSSKNFYIGDVYEVDYETYQTLEENTTSGTIELVSQEGLLTVYITVEAIADVSDIGYTVGSQEIRIGTQVPVKGKGFASYGYIVGLETVEEAK